MLRLAEEAGINHGYLENIIFSPAVQRGRDIIWRRGVPNAGKPYLARATEEHSGPHAAWFWQGDRQGGGVVTDMMCHSVEVCRFLLTAPGAARETLRPRSVNGAIANLKWTRPAYARQLQDRYGPAVDYTNHPSEDFARALVTLVDEDGSEVLVETTTSWAYVGPGLRTRIELLGPEYAMDYSTLDSGLKVFFSREVTGSAGEDLVEKQNAEQGQMPVAEDEANSYGYTLENRHFVDAFRAGRTPDETFRDGVAVMEVLMAVYLWPRRARRWNCRMSSSKHSFPRSHERYDATHLRDRRDGGSLSEDKIARCYPGQLSVRGLTTGHDVTHRTGQE